MVTRLLKQEQPYEIVWNPAADPRLEAVLLRVRDRWAPQATLRRLELTGGDSSNLNPRNLKRPTISHAHRIAFGLSNLVSRFMSVNAGQRQPIIYFNYQTLNTFLLALLRDQRFAVLFANRPALKLWLTAARYGAKYFVPDAGLLSARDRSALERLQQRWREIRRTPQYQARFCIDDVDLWPVLQSDFDSLFEIQLPKTLALVRGCQQTMAQLRPGCIVLPADVPYLHRVLVEAARSLQIPSVVLLHGLPPGENQCGQYLQTDYIFGWGPAMIDLFVSTGSHADRIVTTGFPQLDVYHSSEPRFHANHRPARVMVLTRVHNFSKVLCTDDEPALHLQSILSALNDLPSIQLIVRPHPSERGQYYHELLRQWGMPDLPVRDGGPIAQLLAEADLIIGDNSTVSVEAVAAGIPYLCVRFHRYAYDPPFDGQSGIEVITDPQVLRERVIQFLNGTFENTAASVLTQYTGPLDGHATARVLDALAQIGQRRTTGELA
jgi:hypothetical protein